VLRSAFDGSRSGPRLAAPRAHGTILRGTGEWRAWPTVLDRSATHTRTGVSTGHPLMRRRLAPVAVTATSGGSHHAATPAVCSSQVTASAAATAAATVQSSPMTNPYQNFPKARSPRRLAVPARLSQETIS
jgi:hypothetical protein